MAGIYLTDYLRLYETFEREVLDYNNLRDTSLGKIDRITSGNVQERMSYSSLDLFRDCAPCVITGGRHETEI